jgi:hypothetical protein
MDPISDASKRPEDLKMCLAVRGNGNYIFSHFGAMSRLLEEFGPMHGIAGGSSGSLTSFLYENIYRSRPTWGCEGGSRACSNEQAGLRMSLSFKSLLPYIGLFREYSGLQSQFTGRNKIKIGMNIKSINASIEKQDWPNAASSIYGLISKGEFSDLINPDVVNEFGSALESENNDDQLRMLVLNFSGAIEALNWKIDNSTVLFRKGLVRMDKLANMAGVIADFYTGIEGSSAKDLGLFLDQCAAQSRGKSWAQVAGTTTQVKSAEGVPLDCGQLFQGAVLTHFGHIFGADSSEGGVKFVTYEPQSINEPIGKYLTAIVPNSFFDDPDAKRRFQEANAQFASNGQPPALNFDNLQLKYGYYGQDKDLQKIQRGTSMRSDLRSRKAAILGERTWKEVLNLSPREPGIDSAQCMISEASGNSQAKWVSVRDVADVSACIKVSTGGWPDLEPIPVLQDVGCKEVILIQRAGPATKFALAMTTFLSKDTVQRNQVTHDLYNLENPASSYSMSLDMASGVLCTNWDSIEPTQLECMYDHSYNSKVQVKDPQRLQSKLIHDDELSRSLIDTGTKTYGCQAGALPNSMPPPVQCPGRGEP